MKMASRSIDLISKKQIARAAHFFFLISKKTRAARLLSFFAVVFHNYNAVTHYSYGEIVVCAYPIFCLL